MENEAMARLGVLMSAMTTTAEKTRANIMLYGMSSAGKSHLGLEIAEMITKPGKAIFHVDTSDNKDRVLEYVHLTHPYANMPFTTIEDLRIITEAMAEGAGPFADVGTIVLDEASSMAKDDLDRVYEARLKAIDAGQIATPKTGRPDTPDWADYRPALQRFRSMLTNLYKVPGLNIILIAHETTDPKLMNMVVPDFSNETRKAVKSKLHLMARLVADDVVVAGTDSVAYTRTVQINPTKSVDAKSCIGVPNIRFDAIHLPMAVKAWLDRGAPVFAASEPVEEIETNPMNVKGDTPTEDVKPVFDMSDLDEITPIS